jgi:hypothetical protein
MNDGSDLFHPDPLPDHESGLRRMMADAAGIPYVALKSLEEARPAPDAVVIFEGDDGGQIYAVVRAADVRCGEETLKTLLYDLDAHAWKDPASARLFYERRPLGATIPGGMGGGRVVEGTWVHADLRFLEASIAAVLRGERERI